MKSDHGGQAESRLGAAREKINAATLGAKGQEIGRVEEVGDGIALISGLPDARLGELLKFERGIARSRIA
jgi:F-type H+-transporting ATPase subunit alpha